MNTNLEARVTTKDIKDSSSVYVKSAEFSTIVSREYSGNWIMSNPVDKRFSEDLKTTDKRAAVLSAVAELQRHEANLRKVLS
jgi:hypothetical protein